LPRKAKSDDTEIKEEIAAVVMQEGEGSKATKRTTSTKGRGAYWISSGSDLMDEVVGGGRGLGYETGLVVVFESDSGHGKSFAGHEVVAAAYHKYKEKCKWLYLDVESGATFDSKALYGFEIMPPNVEDRSRPQTIEDCLNEIVLFGNKIKDKEFGVVIIDSIDGLMAEEMQDRVQNRATAYSKEKEFDKGSYGMQKAKFLSQEFFPTVNALAEKKNLLIIIMAQYREAQGQYGAKKVLSNGKAMPYYPHIRVKFLKKNEIEIKGRPIGAVLQVETTKMKGPRPYRHCYVVLHYTRGIDNVLTNIDYLYDLRTADRGDLKKGAEEKALPFEEVSLPRLELAKYIEQNNLEGRLSRKVLDMWEDEEEQAMKQLEGRKARYG
jgi:RecA/RadA recombinase